MNGNKAMISVGGVRVMIFPKFRVNRSVCSLVVKITLMVFFFFPEGFGRSIKCFLYYMFPKGIRVFISNIQ